MCSPFEWAMVAAATVTTGVTVAQAAQGGPAMPELPPLPEIQEEKLAQAEKRADADTASAIKSAKKRSGVATPQTLLTGASGVSDEELNLGGQALGPGKTWV